MHACWVASVMPDSLRPHGLSPPGSSVHGILQARILEWVAMLSSRGSSRSKDRIRVSCVSCIGRWVLYPQCHLGSPRNHNSGFQYQWFLLFPARDTSPMGRSLLVGRGSSLPFSSVQLLSHVRLLATPWTAAHQASLSITNSQSLLKLTSIELVMPSKHLILCHPLLPLPSSFPSLRVLSNESVLHIRWPEY